MRCGHSLRKLPTHSAHSQHPLIRAGRSPPKQGIVSATGHFHTIFHLVQPLLSIYIFFVLHRCSILVTHKIVSHSLLFLANHCLYQAVIGSRFSILQSSTRQLFLMFSDTVFNECFGRAFLISKGQVNYYFFMFISFKCFSDKESTISQKLLVRIFIRIFLKIGTLIILFIHITI